MTGTDTQPRPLPDPSSPDPRDDPFPNEPTPDQPVLPLPGEDPGAVDVETDAGEASQPG